ncbi:hypothetical protein GGU10DRAFT_37836 [Lentinula aff. detonsa]|uniref:Uncharacterized protein n=1 Tax=Lentinula aff. detonsa TaxID=2804958 RepID=A0AA38NR56_9AGAR|nr:hypothetical protein GGU10DRAFT_37836 [Lentinula aff. detonsa]
MRPVFAQFLANRYQGIKAEHPGKGRRYWHLRALYEFLASNPATPRDSKLIASPPESVMNTLTEDDDPCDVILSDVIGGIILRTDFTDDEAWKLFTDKLEGTENENSGVGQNTAYMGSSSAEASASTEATHADVHDGDDSSDDSEDEAEQKLIKTINPIQSEERAMFQNISNLRALRLFNDVDIRPAPSVPDGSKRISPPNPLVDFAGWQEIYTGVTLWIYDTQSNTDHSARLVSAEGDIYGTATGDSWRAQVSHIPHLQLDMTYENMKINFGGMDRWDYSERKRNLAEAILEP